MQKIKKNNPRFKNEQKSRADLFATARELGCEQEVKLILEKYERAMLKCTNDQEREHIAITGLAEIHKLMGVRGPLVVNGREILPGEPGWENLPQFKRLTKL